MASETVKGNWHIVKSRNLSLKFESLYFTSPVLWIQVITYSYLKL